MSINFSVMFLGIIFVFMLLAKIIQNYRRKRKFRHRELLNTSDIINVLFNVGLFTAGISSILLSLELGFYFFGTELSFAQPIINFLAGILFIWFSIRNIYYGGKI